MSIKQLRQKTETLPAMVYKDRLDNVLAFKGYTVEYNGLSLFILDVRSPEYKAKIDAYTGSCIFEINLVEYS